MADHTVTALPPDLPVPEDDGAADGLTGTAVPAIELAATDGAGVALAAAAQRDLVVYVYPRTGLPGEPDSAEWDAIPGARGCTPESCAFRDHAAELAGLGAAVHGLSAQPLAEQREFAAREHLPFALLNDSHFLLAEKLGLPTFEFQRRRFYRRLTFIAREGRIAKVFYPVFPADRHAEEVVAWLRENPAAFASCALDADGLGEQRARYAELSRDVLSARRTPDALLVEFDDRVDHALLEQTLDVERACCPFFRFELDDTQRRLRVTVETPEQLPALDAIASALAPV